MKEGQGLVILGREPRSSREEQQACPMGRRRGRESGGPGSAPRASPTASQKSGEVVKTGREESSGRGAAVDLPFPAVGWAAQALGATSPTRGGKCPQEHADRPRRVSPVDLTDLVQP